MSPYLKKIAFFLLLVLFSIFYAFQKPDPKKQVLPDDLTTLKKQARTYVAENKWDQALITFKELQQQCLVQNLDTLAINFYSDIQFIHVSREDRSFEEKLAAINSIRQKEAHPLFTGLYYDGLAQLYSFYGSMDSLQKYYDLAIHCFQEEKTPMKEFSLSFGITVEFYIQGNIQAAKAFLEKTEKIYAEHLKPNNINISKIHNIQAAIYAELGEFSKALESSQISVKELEKDSLSSNLDLVHGYNNLAALYSYLYDFNSSLIYYQKALDLLQKDDPIFQKRLASIYANIGSTYHKLRNHIVSKKMLLKSLQHLQKVPTRSKEVLNDYINIYQDLFSCYYDSDNLDSAKYYLEKAALLNEKTPYRKYVTLEHYGRLYQKIDSIKSREYYIKALDLATQIHGTKYFFTGDLYLSIGRLDVSNKNWSSALYYTQKALESISIDFSDHHGFSNPKLENVLLKREFLSILERKFEIFNALLKENNPRITIKDIFNTAKLATEALEIFNKSIHDPISKRYWLSNKAIPVFEKAIQTALNVYEKNHQQKYLNEAFMLAERSKSMLMMGAFQEVTASSYGGVPDSLIKTAQLLQQKMEHAGKLRLEAKLAGDLFATQVQDSLIFDYRYQLDVLKHTFETKYPKYYELKYASHVADIEQIQATLDAKTTFIEYFEGVEQLYAFSISKDSVRVHIIAKAEALKLEFFEFQQNLMRFNDSLVAPADLYNQFVSKAHSLYQRLLEPCLNEPTQRLIIIPDGRLSSFPFEVLLRKPVDPIEPNATHFPFDQLHYLIRDYTISYNYSGTLLLHQQATKDQIINGEILALAPSYQTDAVASRGERTVQLRDDLGDLPGATLEVEDLRQHFEGLFLTGTEANETSFKEHASEFGILHLAMHGLVNHQKPEYSCLAMTEDQQANQDNFLHAYEIKQLALQAGLVVLSACETGSGKYQRGEGVLSIGRGFMYAGAPSLIMTLWQLNDASGAVIIKSFYQNLSKGMEKDEALRQAKLAYLNQNHEGITAHPFLWAAFVQVGDYSSISIDSKSNWMPYAGGGLAICLLGFLGFKRRANRQVAA